MVKSWVLSGRKIKSTGNVFVFCGKKKYGKLFSNSTKVRILSEKVNYKMPPRSPLPGCIYIIWHYMVNKIKNALSFSKLSSNLVRMNFAKRGNSSADFENRQNFHQILSKLKEILKIFHFISERQKLKAQSQ